MPRNWTLRPDSYEITEQLECPLCEESFKVDEVITLVPVAPRDDTEAAKMKAGRVYTAEARCVHRTCAHTIWPDDY